MRTAPGALLRFVGNPEVGNGLFRVCEVVFGFPRCFGQVVSEPGDEALPLVSAETSRENLFDFKLSVSDWWRTADCAVRTRRNFRRADTWNVGCIRMVGGNARV